MLQIPFGALLIVLIAISKLSSCKLQCDCTFYGQNGFTYCKSNERCPDFEPRKTHIACLILARNGSKGIPKKNLIKLNGISLLQRSLLTVFEFGKFDSVWVSTDGIDIGKEASSVGAQVHWRSAETATDSAPSIWGVQEFSSLHPEIDVVALVQCTSPFLRVSFLEKAYNMMQGGSFDSVFSATREHKLRWRNLRDGTVEPINFNPKKRPRRQDWEGELVENGMFYFAKKKLIAEGLLQGGRTGVVEIPKNCSNEIDSIFDLEIAAAQVDAQLSVL